MTGHKSGVVERVLKFCVRCVGCFGTASSLQTVHLAHNCSRSLLLVVSNDYRAVGNDELQC